MLARNSRVYSIIGTFASGKRVFGRSSVIGRKRWVKESARTTAWRGTLASSVLDREGPLDGMMLCGRRVERAPASSRGRGRLCGAFVEKSPTM